MKTQNQIWTVVRASSSFIIFSLIAGLGLIHCGTNEAGTRVGNPPSTTSTAYPENLAISSPLETAGELSSTTTAALNRFETSGTVQRAFTAQIGQISDILNGAATTDCGFDPARLLQGNRDAQCYGPRLNYLDHPDAGFESADGQMPPGDLGIWQEYEPDVDGNETLEACAAAELNSRMRGMANQSQVSLEALASLICVSNVNDVALPTSGETSDLTDEMNAMAESNELQLDFSSATLSATSENVFNYVLDFDYTDGDGIVHGIAITMSHQATDDANYVGRFTYAVDKNDSNNGNCPDDNITGYITDVGFANYELSSTSGLKIRTDAGIYCGHGTTPATTATGALDPSANIGNSAAGWANNYTISRFNLDPDKGSGNFSMVWQAGSGDDNSRVFDITLDDTLSGTAFFGYGDVVTTSVGDITGFICNWAGPGRDHTEQALVQRQGIVPSDDGTLFTSVPDELNILYAPTNSCDYDGLGSFTFGLDGDTAVYSDPAVAITNELLPITDADGTFDEITAAGFVLPTDPAGL